MTAQWLNQSKTQKTWFDLKIGCKSVLPLPCLHSSSSPPGFGWVLISFKPENTDEDEKHCYVHYTDGKDNIVDQPVEDLVHWQQSDEALSTSLVDCPSFLQYLQLWRSNVAVGKKITCLQHLQQWFPAQLHLFNLFPFFFSTLKLFINIYKWFVICNVKADF